VQWPVAWIVAVWREDPRRFGLTLGDWRLGLPITVAGIAGTTVRFKMASTSDFSNLTNFFYDTLSLKATYCP